MTEGAEPGESPKQRVDRELGEALSEIRVALPGVELLFGFLLILPFSERFELLADEQRGVYLASFVLAAGAVALLIAPTAWHRLNFRRVDKLELLQRVNRHVVCALLLIGAAIALAAYLVGSVILRPSWAGLLAGAVAAWFAWFWFVAPAITSVGRSQR